MLEGIGRHDPLAFTGVVGCWDMDELEDLDIGLGTAPTVVDQTGSYHLQAEAGTIRLTPLAPGHVGVAFDGATRLYHPDALPAMTGDMAVGGVIVCGDQSSTSRSISIQDIVALVGTVANSSAHNYQWSFRVRNDICYPAALHESGTGTDRALNDTAASLGPGSVYHFWLSRISAQYRIWINGALTPLSPSSVLTVPDGGGSARLRVGGHGAGTNWFRGALSSLILINGTTDSDDALLAYAQTVGLVV